MVQAVRMNFPLAFLIQPCLDHPKTRSCPLSRNVVVLRRVIHGAGCIYALASFFAFAAPNARFLLFFVLPMPAWACVGGIGCFDVYNAFTRQVRCFFSS